MVKYPFQIAAGTGHPELDIFSKTIQVQIEMYI
jgi:hypothetical protein